VNDLPIVRIIGIGDCWIDAYVEAHILMSKTCGDAERTVARLPHSPGGPCVVH
jgi:hypothetical protein